VSPRNKEILGLIIYMDYKLHVHQQSDARNDAYVVGTIILLGVASTFLVTRSTLLSREFNQLEFSTWIHSMKVA